MPIYKYVCEDCDYEVSELMSMEEKNSFDPGYCPECSGEMLREFSIGMVTGGGGGWCGRSNNWSPEKSAALKRESDGRRREMGLERLNVEKNIH